MEFRTQISDLNNALNVVSVVQPRPIQNQVSGYLFVVKESVCTIYSQDTTRKVKTTFEVTNTDGDGSFIFPVDKVSSLKYLDGYADFVARKDGDRYVVAYESESGAKQEFSSFDPLSIKPFDDEMANAKSVDTYPAAVLREGLNLMKGFLLSEGDSRAASEEAFKAIQLFDGKTEATKNGNGTLYAADKVRAGYFFCEVFKDKAMAVSGQHLPTLLGYLAKCEGDVTLHSCEAMTFAVNSKGEAFGWSHQTKTFEKYSAYGLKTDGYILRCPKEMLVKALRYIRGGLSPKNDKIRLEYKHKAQVLNIIASEETSRIESAPVGVKAIEEPETGAGSDGQKVDFGTNLNINQLLDLLEPMKGHEVTLRIARVPQKEQAMLRTIEDFYLNEQGRVVIEPTSSEKAYQCRVTRYMPSRK